MTLFGDGLLPDFNPMLTQAAMRRGKKRYRAALEAHRDDGLFALADAMGLLAGLPDTTTAREVLDGLPRSVTAAFVATLEGALKPDPPLGMFIVYVDVPTRKRFAVERADWPRIPQVMIVRGPHPDV